AAARAGLGGVAVAAAPDRLRAARGAGQRQGGGQGEGTDGHGLLLCGRWWCGNYPSSGRGGLGRGALCVWTTSVALSISPASSAGTAFSVRAMHSSMAVRWSGAGFFSTQLVTSD